MKSLALFLLAVGILNSETAEALSFPRIDDSYETSSNSVDRTTADKASLSDSDSRSDDRAPRFAEPKNLKDAYYDGWQDCPNDMFMRTPGKCHPCAACGPDLYVRHICTSKRDTVCDWCLNPIPLLNDDYHLKCADVIQLQSEFNKLLEKRYRSDASEIKRLSSPLMHTSASSSSSGDLDSSFISDAQLPMRISFIHPVYGEIANDASAVTDSDSTAFFRFAPIRSILPTSSTYYEMRFVLQLGFYVVLIAFVYAVCRLLTKARSTYYGTVTVSPPVLHESDNRNIIRAADEIRGKLGKKGYSRLEEFI